MKPCNRTLITQQRAFALLAIGLFSLLAGCAPSSTSKELKVASSTPTVANRLSTLEPTHTVAATVAPTATPRSEPGHSACRPSDRFPSDVTLPELSALRWETLAVNGHEVRQVAGLDYPVFPLDLSPDGKWLMVAFEIEKSTGRAAMAVMDTQAEAHWWLNTQTFFFSPYFADYPYLYPGLYPRWLPDGRLLWVDEAGKVLVWDGQNRRDLDAPEPMGHVVYASDGIAFARSVRDADLWRVDLASDVWEKVTTSRPPEVGALGGYFILAHDGSYALAFH